MGMYMGMENRTWVKSMGMGMGMGVVRRGWGTIHYRDRGRGMGMRFWEHSRVGQSF
jgi:hypothetical protein